MPSIAPRSVVGAITRTTLADIIAQERNSAEVSGVKDYHGINRENRAMLVGVYRMPLRAGAVSRSVNG